MAVSWADEMAALMVDLMVYVKVDCLAAVMVVQLVVQSVDMLVRLQAEH